MPFLILFLCNCISYTMRKEKNEDERRKYQDEPEW